MTRRYLMGVRDPWTTNFRKPVTAKPTETETTMPAEPTCTHPGCDDLVGRVRVDTDARVRSMCRKHRKQALDRFREAAKAEKPTPSKAREPVAPAPAPVTPEVTPDIAGHVIACIQVVARLGGLARAERIAEALQP